MSETRSWLVRARSEPLVWFVAIGLGLFAVDRLRPGAGAAEDRIVIDAAFVEGLRTEAARRTGHAPDEAETGALIDAWVREEALYREAERRELDVGDVIVRRRLVQKIELVLAAEAAPAEPSEQELADYLAEHADRYVAAARTSVTVCFFSRELHEDAAATASTELASGTPHCDPYLAGDTFRERTDAQLAAIVGEEAAAALRDAPIAVWRGPFENVRGVYLVRVDARAPGGPRTLAEVHDEVRDALVRERREAVVRAREAEITARYEVVRL